MSFQRFYNAFHGYEVSGRGIQLWNVTCKQLWSFIRKNLMVIDLMSEISLEWSKNWFKSGT